MTQEEKLEEAKRLYETENADQKYVLESLFPELKESEDEMIRKALINGFNKLDKSAVWYNGITNGQILAWLEKQGEQKLAFEMKTPEESLGIDSDTYNKIVDECVYELEEQKPAWSEDDDRMYNIIVSFIPQHLTAESYTACINWLKSLRPQNTWKPSDEQMVALKHAFNDGSIVFADMKILATLYEQLKALHRYEQDT